MSDRAMALIKGTLDVLILKAVSWGPLHGYAISRWLRQTTKDALKIEEGALYPALRRLEKRGLLSARWALTETNREAKFYELTERGSAALESEMHHWQRYVEAMSRVLFAASPAEA